MSNLITHTITYTIQLSETERTYALYLSTQTLSTFTPQPSVLKPFSRLQPSVLKTRTPITRQYLNPKYLDPLLIIIISFFLLTSLNELPCIQNLPVCFGDFVPLDKFSLIWRRHHYRERGADYDQYSALIAMTI